jgi:hypothetical protein
MGSHTFKTGAEAGEEDSLRHLNWYTTHLLLEPFQKLIATRHLE